MGNCRSSSGHMDGWGSGASRTKLGLNLDNFWTWAGSNSRGPSTGRGSPLDFYLHNLRNSTRRNRLECARVLLPELCNAIRQTELLTPLTVSHGGVGGAAQKA